MLRKMVCICNCKIIKRYNINIKRTLTTALIVDNSQITTENNELLDISNMPTVILRKKSVLDKCEDDISHVAPYLKPTFNFASYVNKSVTLQELLKLGVNLHKLEKKVSVPPYILGLDFEKDIKNHVICLHNIGLEISDIGALITKNPYIFKQNLDDIEVRINYLEAKKFQKDMIIRILSMNPYWLMFNTQRIDTRLGFFQKEFALSGSEVRHLTVKQPKLITYNIQHIKMNMFVTKEEMGFDDEERKKILLKKPKLFMKEKENLLETFEYLHNTMEVPLEHMVELPEILLCRQFRLKQRHMFLEKLGKMQLNPTKPEYISILNMIEGNDVDFCTNVAKSHIDTFNMFLKTM